MQSLVSMRLRDLLDDEEYLVEKRTLQERIHRLKREIESAEHGMERAIEIAENVIHYAARAQRAFSEGTPEEQRRIVSLLGSRFVLTDGKVLLEHNPYLVLFFEDHEELSTIKPPESGSGTRKGPAQNVSVLSGSGSRTVIKLLELIRSRAEYFPSIAGPVPVIQ